ncbi:hypothetical protein CDCA_CDCA12G3379 [Cyanidium caldarium]|uniref:Misato Segment II tubulin-like domain-containing protein n=1 Tax=Cyanidium caldarium TaxID=2771 RepID=A0AAV9IYJ3_CYACA|nr:hypothetical protein CDCA_CDCA12G3379 [Cyanidium caldarium]
MHESPGGELITVQVGTTANYFGAHYWNLLDEQLKVPAQGERCRLGCRRWFREAVDARGAEHVAPRTIVFDARPEFGCLTSESEDTVSADAHAAWRGHVQRLELVPSMEKHAFTQSLEHSEEVLARDYRFDESVRHWSDYLQLRLPPWALVEAPVEWKPSHAPLPPEAIVEHFQQARSGNMDGISVAADTLLERVRRLAEECDQWSGVDVFTSATSPADAGLTALLTERLVDEQAAKMPIVVRGVDAASEFPLREWVARQCGEALLFADLATSSTAADNDHLVYVPLRSAALGDGCGGLLPSRTANVFQSAALLAAAACAHEIGTPIGGTGVHDGLHPRWPISGRHRLMVELRAAMSAASRPGEPFSWCLSVSPALRRDWRCDRRPRERSQHTRLGDVDTENAEDGGEWYRRALALLNTEAAPALATAETRATLRLPVPFPASLYAVAKPLDHLRKDVGPQLTFHTTSEQSLCTGADIDAWASLVRHASRLLRRPGAVVTATDADLFAEADERLRILADAYIEGT